jgi:hypothetical protein
MSRTRAVASCDFRALATETDGRLSRPHARPGVHEYARGGGAVRHRATPRDKEAMPKFVQDAEARRRAIAISVENFIYTEIGNFRLTLAGPAGTAASRATTAVVKDA